MHDLNIRTSLRTAALIAAAVSTSVATLHADTSQTRWTGAATGYWSDAASWTDSVHGDIVPQDNTPMQFQFYNVLLNNPVAITQDLPSVEIIQLSLGNNVGVNISNYNKLTLFGSLNGYAAGNSNGSVFVQNNATFTSYSTGFLWTGLVKLQSIDGLSEYKAGADVGQHFVNRGGTIWLSGLTASSHDRFDGVNGNETFDNYGTLGGGGEVFGFDAINNFGTINGGAAGVQLLKITSNTFDNDPTTGKLVVIAGGGLRIEATNLPHMSGNAINGGIYDIAGRLVIPHAAEFHSLYSADLTLRGDAYVTPNGSTSLLYNVESNYSKIHVTDSGTQYFGGANDFSNYQNGTLTVDGKSTVYLNHALFQDYNSVGTFVGTGAGAGKLFAKGLHNNGLLNVYDGTADFRAGTLDTFVNLNPTSETLERGTYDLGGNGTLIVDAGSGVHGGEILTIGSTAHVIIRRNQQFQYGPNALDAMSELTENDGLLDVLQATPTYTPVGGTFTNAQPTAGYGGVMTIQGASTRVVILGNLNNDAAINLSHSGYLGVSEAATVTANGQLNDTDSSSVGISDGLTNNGTVVVNRSSFDAFGYLKNNNVYSVDDGTTFTDALDNSGKLTVVNDGYVEGTKTFHNHPTGTLTLGTNAGDPAEAAFGAFTNEGRVEVASNAQLSGDSYTQTAGLTLIAGGKATVTAVQISGGELEGFGSIAGKLSNSAGTVLAQDGNLAVTGDYSQSTPGTLLALIGYDHYVTATGNVDLGGALTVALATGLNVAPGDTFEVLHFDGTRTGNFTSFNYPTVDGLTFQEVVTDHDIKLLAVVPEPTTMLMTSFAFAGLIRRRK